MSVLMTAYNRENYIRAAIESVLSSTFVDFELVIVDDKSIDNTLSIAREYESDERVRVSCNEKNVGDYANRNRAATLARGTYIKYLDSDDAMYPHGLEVMVSTMEAYPSAGLGIGRPPRGDRPHPILYSSQDAYRHHFLGGGLLDSGPTACIMRRDAFNEAGGFGNYRYVGDTELWLRMAARFPVVTLVDGLVWWRRHDGQEYNVGHSSDAYGRLNYEVSRDRLVDPACPLTGPERAAVLAQQKRGYVRYLLSVGTRKRRPTWMVRNLWHLAHNTSA